jgi:site-specific recombinase XerD
MAKNDVKVGDNPKLLQKVMSDGNLSLYLDYYLGRVKVTDEVTGEIKSKVQRKREFLHLTIFASPRTPLERQQNKDTLALAHKIRFEREQEFKEGNLGYRLKTNSNINFLDYYQSYIDGYTKKDKRNIELSFKRFKDFLSDTPEYKKFSQRITPQQIDRDMILAFVEYLQSRSVGEGAHTLYARFKKVVAYAFEHGVFLKNPCNKITIKIDRGVLKKDVLSQEEMQQLIATHYKRENPNIRRAFIFCLYTGLRYCDVKDLTFANIDFANHLLKFEQNKTKGHSSNSGVVIPLNDGLLKLIGEPTMPDNRAELVFPLPSYEMCLKAVKRWVKRAGINKHISWHCARHSFAVNILNNGANIKTVASLLGHSGLQCTEKYTRAVDSLKQEAINSLPTLNID